MASSVQLFQNIGLTDANTGGQTSTVGEPSVAVDGDRVFLTGNWYAAKSVDGAATWQFVDPFTALPAADDGFCCDQTVIHVPGRGAIVWLLQYSEANGTNTLRVAVHTGGTLEDDEWHYWDLRPGTTNPDWNDEWFDYNHAALSDNFLYVGTNVFKGDTWTRAVVFRIPLDALVAAGNLSYDYFESVENFSLRCTQGATDTMHLVSHNSLSQVRVFSWPENATDVTATDVDVAPWNAGRYRAPGPDGKDWLGRCDPRITGVWVAQGQIGFMWTANATPGVRPQPFVRVVRVDEATKAVIDEPDIWHADYAYAYPDAYPNASGDVGITVFRGGGTRNPGHIVGFWSDQATGWRLRVARNGTHGPADNKWGDYLTCRRHAPEDETWVAVGFTLEGGGARTDIQPRYVHFGRAAGA